MKHRIALILVLSSLSASAFAISPCQEKEQDIQREISYAEKHHNQHRISKRQRKLDEAQQELKELKSREYYLIKQDQYGPL